MNDASLVRILKHFGKTGRTEPHEPREETKTPKTLDELLARGLVYFAGEKAKKSEE
jgi:hypothetical protein